MTTTYATERSKVGTYLSANWTDCPIQWPNDDLSAFPLIDGEHRLPQPTGDRTDPARFLVVDFSYDDARQITFTGDVETTGAVEIFIHVERGVGDGKLRAMGDSIAALFRTAAADTDGIFFLEPDFDSIEYAADANDWCRQRCRIPFVRFKDN